MGNDINIKRKSKDTVFVEMFKNKEYVLRLYKDLHPEDTTVCLEDIEIQTLDSVIVNNIYNDLGFLARNRYILLFEAQSDWKENIPVRMLLYLCETLRRYIGYTNQSEHYDKKLELPEPELYVVYAGTKTVPSVLSLSDEFFNGSDNIELKIKVLTGADTSTIYGQYVGYCESFDAQRKLHKDGKTAARETVNVCLEKGYLVDFLNEHKEEVIDMMSELFDEETIREQYERARKKDIQDRLEKSLAAGRAEGRAEGVAEGRAKGRAEGIAEGEAKRAIEIATSMLKAKTLSLEDISMYTKLPLEKIEELSARL